MLSNATLYVWLSRLLLSIGVCCQMHHLIFDCPVYYCKIPHAVSLALPFTIGVCCKIHHLIFDSQVYYWHMLECAVKYTTLSLTGPFTIGICCQIHHLIFDWPGPAPFDVDIVGSRSCWCFIGSQMPVRSAGPPGLMSVLFASRYYSLPLAVPKLTSTGDLRRSSSSSSSSAYGFQLQQFIDWHF